MGFNSGFKGLIAVTKVSTKCHTDSVMIWDLASSPTFYIET